MYLTVSLNFTASLTFSTSWPSSRTCTNCGLTRCGSARSCSAGRPRPSQSLRGRGCQPSRIAGNFRERWWRVWCWGPRCQPRPTRNNWRTSSFPWCAAKQHQVLKENADVLLYLTYIQAPNKSLAAWPCMKLEFAASVCHNVTSNSRKRSRQSCKSGRAFRA